MVHSRGGDGKKYLLKGRPIYFGKLSAWVDWYMNGVDGNGDNDRDVVESSVGTGSLKDIVEHPGVYRVSEIN